MQDACEREWNYYFVEGEEVMLDDYCSQFDLSCYYHLLDYLFQKAIVLKCYSDLHAYGRGWLYICKIEFEDGRIETILSSFLVKYDSTCKTSQ